MKNKALKSTLSVIFDNFFVKIFTSWFLTAAVMTVFSKGEITLGFISEADILPFAAMFLSTFFFCSCAQVKFKNLTKIIFITSVLLFSCILALRANTMYVYIALAVIYFLAVRYYFSVRTQTDSGLSKRMQILLIILPAAVFLAIALTTTILRCVTYSAPNFDFGIFCNMYHYMKTSFLPMASCERDKLLSHFAVHVSPALYIFLPVYMIFPSPVTVAVCQTAAIYSGIIPFLLIAKKHKISGVPLVLLSVIFAASPVLVGGTMFDFHENCLLVPFLMWTFYFYENRKTVPMFIFAFLTLLVKEDAFIYIIVFAVYIIFTEKKIKRSAGLIVMGVAYFLFACFMLKTYGEGIMAGRFESMIQEGDGLLGIIKTVLMNPGYTIKQIFTAKTDSPDKLFYFCQLFFPLAFMPFMTKKYSKMILMLPIFLNLLTNYLYQYDIFFQYSFGIETLLLYLSLINIKDMPEEKRHFTATLSAGLSVIMFFMLIMPKYVSYSQNYSENKELYAKMDSILSEIPSDKSVTASAFLIPKLSNRDIIYESFYHKTCDTDLAVFDIRPGYLAESMDQAKEFEAAGYELVYIEDGCLMIYAAPDNQLNFSVDIPDDSMIK